MYKKCKKQHHGNTLEQKAIRDAHSHSLNTKVAVEEVSYDVDDLGGLNKTWRSTSSHWCKIITAQNKSKVIGNKIHFLCKHIVIMNAKSARRFLGKINKVRLSIPSENRLFQITGVNMSDDKYTIIKTSELM